MSLLTLHPPDLTDRDFTLSEVTDQSGRVQVWDVPDHPCGIGVDFAYGIPGRDYDAAVVLDPWPVNGQYRQVGELHGHWGPRMPKVLYAAARFWRGNPQSEGAFIVGERQVGHMTLDLLWNDYGYRNIYRERNMDLAHHPMKPNLGHPRTADDVMMRRLREAVLEKRLLLRSEMLIDQLARCSFYSTSEKTTEDRVGDERLKIKVQGGGSPDLVMALAYSFAAVLEMPRQPVKPKPWAEGTLGAALGHNDDFDENAGNASFATRV